MCHNLSSKTLTRAVPLPRAHRQLAFGILQEATSVISLLLEVSSSFSLRILSCSMTSRIVHWIPLSELAQSGVCSPKNIGQCIMKERPASED